MVIRTLLRHGDTVVVEQPAYANLLQMLRLAGLRVVPVPRHADGLDCEALERVAAQHRPRALFINTALQNPSGASIGMANAFRILQTAERHGLWVVEDDISRELAPGVTPMLAALDGGCRVVYGRLLQGDQPVGAGGLCGGAPRRCAISPAPRWPWA